jgi:ABC-type branched-subunit amino acid transport system substrate-binding protein
MRSCLAGEAWLWLAVGVACWGQPRPPYIGTRAQPLEYPGPGREAPEPRDLGEVRIGYFGPPEAGHPEGGTLWQGATLALEEANREGGYKGLPFRLVPAWAENPWTAGAGVLVRLLYQERVWALIGSIDGAATHLAEQVALKARVTLINPAASDRTIHGASVPWMFSCVPGDHLAAPVLVGLLGGRPFVLVSATDHDSRAFVAELKTAPASHIEFQSGTPDVSALARRVAEAAPPAVVVVAGARDSARVVAALRRSGCAAPVFCGPSAGRRTFREEAGPAAEGVLFPLLAETAGEAARFGAPSDYAAAQAYDAVRLLVAAIRKAGLNRALIRDAVRELAPWPGVSGVIQWDALGQNARPVRLGTIRGGRVVPAARQLSLGAMPRAFILR